METNDGNSNDGNSNANANSERQQRTPTHGLDRQLIGIASVLVGDAGACDAIRKRRERAARKLRRRALTYTPSAVRACFWIISDRAIATAHARTPTPTHAGAPTGAAAATAFKHGERDARNLERRADAAVRNPFLILDDGRRDAEFRNAHLTTERLIWLIEHARGRHKKWLFAANARARRADADRLINSYSTNNTATAATGNRANAPTVKEG